MSDQVPAETGELAREAAVQVTGPAGDGERPTFNRRQAYVTAIASDWLSCSIKFPESTDPIPGVRFMYPSMPPAVGDTVWIDQNGADNVVSSAVGLPMGAITAYDATSPIPAGWLVCNGQSTAGYPLSARRANTPDLRDKFLVGAGGAYALGATGGEATHSLTISEMASHNHSGFNHSHAGPSHNHQGFDHVHGISTVLFTGSTSHSHSGQGGKLAEGPNDGSAASASVTGADGAAYTTGFAGTGSTSSDGSGGTTGASGSGTPHENRPPYYAVVYIIKCV